MFKKLQAKIDSTIDFVVNYIPNAMDAFEAQKHESIKAKGSVSTYDRYEPSKGYHEAHNESDKA